MWWVLTSLVLSAPPLEAQHPVDGLWRETLGGRHADATRGPWPRARQRLEALDDMQRAIELWQREHQGFVAEQVLQERAQEQIGRSVLDAQPLPPEALKGYTIVEPGKRQSAPARRKKGVSKVIELPKRDPLDVELEQAVAEVEAHRKQCEADPERCARQKKQRADLEKGQDAFDEAIEVNYEKRRAQIEAEARSYQAEVEASRRKEAEREAKRLGGTVDAEGNFVDEQLERDLDAQH